MRKTVTMVALCAFFLCSFAIAGEQENYAPPKPLDDATFGWMIGEWNGHTDSPMGKTKDWMRCELALGGQFVHMSYKSETPMGELTGMGVLTMVGDELKGYWVDSWRTMSEGAGRLEGNKMVMTWESPMGSHERITEQADDGRMLMTIKMMQNGQEMAIKSEMTRVGDAAGHKGHSH